MEDCIQIGIWVSLTALYFPVGFLAMTAVDKRYPVQMSKVMGSSCLGAWICLAFWWWTVAVVITLGWRDRRQDDSDRFF